jgi:hypothetical protein
MGLIIPNALGNNAAKPWTLSLDQGCPTFPKGLDLTAKWIVFQPVVTSHDLPYAKTPLFNLASHSYRGLEYRN